MKSERWLQEKGIDDVEEAPMTKREDDHILLQDTSPQSDEWLSYNGPTMPIRG